MAPGQAEQGSPQMWRDPKTVDSNLVKPKRPNKSEEKYSGPPAKLMSDQPNAVESTGCGTSNNQRRLGRGRGARNTARAESPQPKWFTSTMDKMYGYMDVIGRQVEDLLSLLQGSDTWHELQKRVAGSYARIGHEAVEKRKGPSQGSLVRVDTSMKELQGTVALTARNIFREGKANEKSEGDVSADVEQFVDTTVDELLKLHRSISDSIREHFLANSIQLNHLNFCVQKLVPKVEQVHSDHIRDEIRFYRILKDIPPTFVLANQTDLLSASFAELVGKTKQLQQVFSLHEAMEADDKMEIKDLITKMAGLHRGYHHPDHAKRMLTPLCHAVALNSPQLIEMLRAAGGDLSRKPSPIRFAHELGVAANDAFTALAQFPESLRAEDITAGIISRLAKANADINFADAKGRTALHHWAAAGDTELVTALVENEAHLDQRDMDGKTALDLAAELPGAPEELLKVLEYVELRFGLGGEQLALGRSVLEDPPDIVDFLRHFVRKKWPQKNGKPVSYFSIRLTIGDHVAAHRTSWQSLGKPKIFFVTRSGNFREDPVKTKKFLEVASQKGEHADFDLRGHLEDYQDPDAADQREETACYKAARNDDVSKLVLLDLACASFDKQDAGGATALFIASQGGCFESVKFLVEHNAKIDLPLNTEATPLYVACQNGHQPVVDLLLASKADANAPTADLATPVFIASQMGHLGIVRSLIRAKSDIEFANRTKATPLFIASQNDHGEIVECLLGEGACINTTTQGGASPLYIAAQKGSMKALPLLMNSKGVDTNLSAKDGATPILIAAQNGHLEAVNLLIKGKVEVCSAMKSGATAVFVAAQNGHKEVVQVLVEADPELVNKCLGNGTSPFYVAAQNGHMELIKYLHKVGADVEKKSCGGATSFFIAAQNGHLDIVNFILEMELKSARPRDQGQLTEMTNDGSGPLLVASQNGHLQVVQRLTNEMVEAKIPEERRIQLINLQKQGGASALYLACQNGKTDVVAHLISVGACIHQALDTQETPLYIASQGGHEAIVRLLLQEAADVNQGKHDKTTPLYIACQNQHTGVFRLLMDARADPNASNVNGATPLFISSQKGFHEIVRELLEAGADPTLAIQSGACPLYIAAMKGHLQVCRLLLLCDRTNVNQTPVHGTTPLHISTRNGHVEVAELFLEFPGVDVNQADNQGMTPLYTAIKAELWRLGEKFLHHGAFVDWSLFDSGVKMLRSLADKLVTERSTPTGGGYPDAQGGSLQLQFFKKSHEMAKTLLHELHRMDEGIQNGAMSPAGLRQDMSRIQQMRAGEEEALDVFGLVYNSIEQSVSVLDAADVNDAAKTAETIQKVRTTLVSASALMRLLRDTSLKAFSDFLKRRESPRCGRPEPEPVRLQRESPGRGTLQWEKERLQRVLTKSAWDEVQELFKPEGRVEAFSASSKLSQWVST